MAFMSPEITGKQLFWICEDWRGESVIIPYYGEKRESAALHYCGYQGEEIQEAIHNSKLKLRKGYGVRLSAPGYLDCTDWEFFTNKKYAEERYLELEREIEEEEREANAE